MDHAEFLQAMKDRCDQFGSLRKYAKHLNVSPSFVSAVISGKKLPSKIVLEDMGLTMKKTVICHFEPTHSNPHT